MIRDNRLPLLTENIFQPPPPFLTLFGLPGLLIFRLSVGPPPPPFFWPPGFIVFQIIWWPPPPPPRLLRPPYYLEPESKVPLYFFFILVFFLSHSFLFSLVFFKVSRGPFSCNMLLYDKHQTFPKEVLQILGTFDGNRK